MIRTLQIWLLIIYVLGIAALMAFINIKNGDIQVPSTELNIYRGTKDGFLTKSEILNSMQKFVGLDTIKVNQLGLGILEKEILNDPFVESVDAFTNIDGELIVNVNEKQPIVRIFNKKSVGYYLTKEGCILPLSESYSARVLVVNGFLNIPISNSYNNVMDRAYDKTKLKDILKLSIAINNNEFLKSQINQIYINSKSEFELIPEFGSQVILIGDLNNLEKKLQKLEIFYQQALLKEGIDKYKTINLKFDGQVVCARK